MKAELYMQSNILLISKHLHTQTHDSTPRKNWRWTGTFYTSSSNSRQLSSSISLNQRGRGKINDDWTQARIGVSILVDLTDREDVEFVRARFQTGWSIGQICW